MARQKLIHIHSSVYADNSPKAPQANALEYGEIAVNYNSTEPSLFLRDANDAIRQIHTSDVILSKAKLGDSYSIHDEVDDDSLLEITGEDTVTSSIGKIMRIIIDDEEVMSSALNDINIRVNETNDTISELESTVTELGGTITELESTVTELGGTVTELGGTVTELGGTVTELLNKPDSVISDSYVSVNYNDKLSQTNVSFEKVEIGNSLDEVSTKIEGNISKLVDVVIANEETVAGTLCEHSLFKDDIDSLYDAVDILNETTYNIGERTDFNQIDDTYYNNLAANGAGEFSVVKKDDTLETAISKIEGNAFNLTKKVVENEFIVANEIGKLNSDIENLTNEIIDDELAIAEALNVLNEKIENIENNGNDSVGGNVVLEEGIFTSVDGMKIDVKTGTTSTTVAVGNHSHSEFTTLSNNVSTLQTNVNNINNNITELQQRNTIASAQTAAVATQTEYPLTFQTGAYTPVQTRSVGANTFNGSNALTVSIPTSTNHLTNDSGFITTGATVSKANSATTAASAESVAWGNISGKPSTFKPESHTHSEYLTSVSWDDINNKPSVETLSATTITVEGKVNTLVGTDTGKSARAIVQDEVTKQLVSENITESFDTLKEMAEYLSSHPQKVTEISTAITNLQSGKSNIGHKHTKSEITDFPTSLPASDVYSWAKASSKPSYTADEVGASPTGHTHNYAGSSSAGGAATSANKVNSKLTFGSKTFDGSVAATITASDLGALTSHQSIYNLTMEAGAFSAVTFDPNGAAKTVKIPTNTSHLTNDSGFITTGATVSKANSATTAASAESVAWGNVSGKPSTFTPESHTHDDRYFTETEVNNKLAGYSPTGHTHNNYLTGITKSQVTTALGYTPPTSDTNTWRDITNATGNSTTVSMSQSGATALYNTLNNKFSGYSTTGHSHSNYLTSHQTIYDLKLEAGAFSATTFDPNGATKTVKVPTATSHLTNDSGFITTASTVSKANSATTAVSATTAASAAAVAWGNVSGKPSSFTPAAHTHDFITYESGHTSCTSLSNIAITKRLVICTVSASGSFSLSGTPADGRELHVMVKNNGSSDITVTLPTSGYVNLTGDSITVAAGGWAEINVLSDGTNKFLRAL